MWHSECSGARSKISLSLWCSQAAHKQSSNGPEIEPQISLLGGAEEPLMYLAHSHHHCPLIILLSGNISSRGRKLQIKLKTSFAQSRDFDIQFLMPGCRREIVFLRMPWQGGWQTGGGGAEGRKPDRILNSGCLFATHPTHFPTLRIGIHTLYLRSMFKGSGKMLSAAVLMDWEKKGKQGKSVRRVNATWVGPRIVRCSVTLPLTTQVLLHDPPCYPYKRQWSGETAHESCFVALGP